MDNFNLKQFLIENKLTRNSHMMETDESKSFTVISSYASRNDMDDHRYAYVRNAADAREALVKCLTTEENYSVEEALEYVAEIETRFSHKKLRKGKEVWATDDEYFIVVPGEISNDTVKSTLRSVIRHY